MKPLSREQSMMLATMLLSDQFSKDVIENEDQFLSLQTEKVRENMDLLFFPCAIQKRIDYMKLPIRFTNEALIAVLAMCDRIGAAIMLLVDCLDEFTPKVDYVTLKDMPRDAYHIVSLQDLIDMYPWGFYDFDDSAFQDFMETKIKRNRDNFDFKTGEDKREERWSFVYE